MEFTEFPKMPRLSREMIITEKIDGTNGQIIITEDGDLFVGSRTRFITPEDDNYGFARWCFGNKDELLKMGPGRHFGEWWGQGIQRGYGLKEKRFSLFNVSRWKTCCSDAPVLTALPSIQGLGVVPILFKAEFDTNIVNSVLQGLAHGGSVAAPGFMNPEGIIVWHTAGNFGFKKTIKNDEVPKSKVISVMTKNTVDNLPMV
jgi:hypothetical protein